MRLRAFCWMAYLYGAMVLQLDHGFRVALVFHGASLAIAIVHRLR